jgi:heme-degrading monooxygenase HmoA
MRFREMDEHVALADQLGEDVGPVVLINEFTVDPKDADDLVAAWAGDASYFKCRPGFIAAQLHRGIAGSGAFINYAVWESVAHFRDAFNQPEFRSRLAAYPESTVASPHLFKKVAVPGICVSC